MVGMYVLYWLDIGYLDYRSVFCRNRLLFTDNIFQAKAWTTFETAYRNALKLCKPDKSYEYCLIVKYDFMARKHCGISIVSDVMKEVSL